MEHFPSCGMGELKAYQKLNNIISNDGDTACDLGSFTCTEMDSFAQKIYLENIDKNLVNVNEYQKTTEVELFLGKEISNLVCLEKSDSVFSRSTAGSSEAIGMAMLIHKSKWIEKRSENGKPHPNSIRPNIVFCSDAHLCWHKFANYFSVEIREIQLRDDDKFPFDEFISKVDENTIVTVALAGSTYTGTCDPIQELCSKLVEHNDNMEINVGIHVDAAIGGFALPFIAENEHYIWDFRNPLVESINLSNHKFGLVYPGLGWLVCRDLQSSVNELTFNSNYLFGESDSFSLNFSRPASPILVQYYNFLRHGFDGYRKIINRCNHLAKVLAKQLESSGIFTVVSDGILPVVAFTFTNRPGFKVSEYVNVLRRHGWMLPCYTLKTPCESVVMRIVVRHSSKLSDYKRLHMDMLETYEYLNNRGEDVG